MIQEKSFQLSKGVALLYLNITNEKKEYILSKQLLRSGTSVGANIQEAQAGQSRKDFIYKTNLAYKEAEETLFWLKLIKEIGLVNEIKVEPVLSLCDEVCRILCAILKTANKNMTDSNKR